MALLLEPIRWSLIKSYVEMGYLLALPTETVFGLAAPISSEKHIKKIFEFKGRPSSNPLIVHVSSQEEVWDLVTVTKEDKEVYQQLLDTFTPGPVTILFPKSGKISDTITAGSSLVGIRIPSHPVAQQALKELGPVCAPSANISNHVSGTSWVHVWEDFEDKKVVVLRADASEVGVESTIIKPCVETKTLQMLRYGGLTPDKLVEIAGKIGFKVEMEGDSNKKENDTLSAPGQLTKHYSCHIPCYLIDNLEDLEGVNVSTSVFVDLDSRAEGVTCGHYLNIPKEEFAKGLYSTLRIAEQLSAATQVLLYRGGLEKDDPYYDVVYDRFTRACSGKKLID